MRKNLITNQRSSNIELLRILAAIGVIVLHYNNTSIGGALGAVADGSASAIFLYFLEALFICAVDLFVMILGYFQSRKQSMNISKPTLLVLQVSIVSLVSFLLKQIIHAKVPSVKALFSACLPVNHFIAIYCTVLILSPYLNLLWNHLNAKRRQIFIAILLFLFSLHPTVLSLMGKVGFDLDSMSTISNTGSNNGYSLVNYILMYFLGAMANNVSLGKKSILLFFACQLPLFALEVISGALDINVRMRAYCNPLVIGCAFFALLSFKDLNIGSRRWINDFAGGSFMVYLTHKRLFPLFHIGEAVERGFGSLIGNLLLTCVICYLAGWILHKLYTFLLKPFTLWFGEKTKGLVIDTGK